MRVIAALIMVVLRFAPGFAQETKSLTREEGAVRAIIVSLFAAAERKDVAALDTLYAGQNLTIIEGAGINRGWVDYRDHHLVPELKEFSDFKYRPFEIEPHVRGNLAWVVFRYALQAAMPERSVDIIGRGTAVLERTDGKWLIRHTQTSGRARRNGDPPMPQ